MAHTAAGIAALLDLNGLVEQAPQLTEFLLLFSGAGLLKLIHAAYRHRTIFVQQHHSVSFIEDQKALLRISFAKVPRDERQHDVLGLNLRNQDAVRIGEAYEAFKQMCLIVQMLDSAKKCMHRFVSQPVHDRGAVTITKAHKLQNQQILLGMTGHKSAPQEIQRLIAHLFWNGFLYAFGVFHIRLNCLYRQQKRQRQALLQHVHRQLIFFVALEHTAQQPVEAAVIAINDRLRSAFYISPLRHFCSSSRANDGWSNMDICRGLNVSLPDSA